jgi:O-antigen ligase
MVIGVIAGGLGGLAAVAVGATTYLMLDDKYGQGVALLVALAGGVVTWLTSTLATAAALKRFTGE